jgi:hypothetical protein
MRLKNSETRFVKINLNDSFSYPLKASDTPLCKIFPALIFKPFANA